MKQEPLQRLKNKIKEKSCNSLCRIYPLQLQEWIEATNEEIKDFISELLEEGLMECKYDFQCSCGNNCTVYQNKIEIDLYQCDECERQYRASEILDKGTLLYELDKQALLNFGEEKVDFKNITNTGKVVIMPVKRGEENKMSKMEIFLGSSLEAKDFMEKIAIKLEELGVKPLLWNAKGEGIFVASTNTIDALISIAHRVKAAIFVFNSDDKIWNEKTSLEGLDCVRDNVLFEYGLFMGTLGKQNVCFICKEKPKIASDLKGITYIDGDEGEYSIKSRLRDWINTINQKQN